ncbi:MAG: glutamine amidotransferase [Raoultibacter sp.]
MEPLKIAYLFPDLLNLYGDGGNVTCLQKRCEWRGIPVETILVNHGESIDLECVDIVFLGGGPDREQRLASEQLLRMKDDLSAYVEHDGVLLAICGGYQILGSEWLLGSEIVEGLGIIDMVTHRGGANRLIDNVVLRSPVCERPVVGYENHAGRTILGEGMRPFGTVISKTGHGNDDTSGSDGVLYRNLVGTYLHGPLLGKNPGVADYLLKRALERKQGAAVDLTVLDDAVENAANEFICNRFGGE